MNNVALVYLNSFAVLVLLLVLRNYRRKLKSICCEEKVFILFIFATLVMLVDEAAIENLWGVPGQAIRILLYILQTLDYCLAVAIPMLWLYYCLFRIFHISSIGWWLRCLVALPAMLYAFVVLVTLPGGGAFGISENNQNILGIAYVGSYVLGFMYIAAAAVIILAKRKTLNRGELIPYLLVPVIPVTLALIEIVFQSLTGLMWAATSLVILEIQMLVLNNRTNIDHLTSLNNRMALDTYTRRMMEECRGADKPLGLIMIDVDDFKQINDRYGHIEGDRALKATAEILRECFGGRYFIARYGGDEFAAVLKDCGRELMAQYLKKMEDERIRKNIEISKPYAIRLSIGAYIFRGSEIVNLHRLYMKVDELMYRDKNAKKKTAATVG
ncbi:MAG: GGDEF domain-containing protein [Clostridiales bacterium]|nr:GGDEF domain-containing protein [Clostridiales bacterium]